MINAERNIRKQKISGTNKLKNQQNKPAANLNQSGGKMSEITNTQH